MLVTSTLFKVVTALLVFAIIAYLAATVFHDTLFSFLNKEKTIKIKLVGTPNTNVACSSSGNNYVCDVSIKNVAIDYGGNEEQEATAVVFFKDRTGLATLDTGKPIILKDTGNVFSFNTITIPSDSQATSGETIILGFFKKNKLCEILAQNNEERQIFLKQCGKDMIGSVILFAGISSTYTPSQSEPIQVTNMHTTASECTISFAVKNTLGYEWKDSDNIYLRFVCDKKDIRKKLSGLKPDEILENPLTQSERTCPKGSLIQIYLYEKCSNPNNIDSCVVTFGTGWSC